MREVAIPILSPNAVQTPNAFHSIKLFRRFISAIYKTSLSIHKSFYKELFTFKNITAGLDTLNCPVVKIFSKRVAARLLQRLYFFSWVTDFYYVVSFQQRPVFVLPMQRYTCCKALYNLQRVYQ
jgi:hypothetical protein